MRIPTEHARTVPQAPPVGLTCLVFSIQLYLEHLAPIVDSDFHCVPNSSGVWYSMLVGSHCIEVLAPVLNNDLGACSAVKPVHGYH